ncbi:MAG: HAMP domain-containing protein [Calditrichaeota bacterium]|nr:MAG: HAMP domain-containing protein [Calditrichota bacterium]MBL1207467.1 HAMP domain-containing protein [Calditrichota bacterium]NOG47299.1 HAMP domain-containing protein [Calditrichota bacterium]
MISLRWKIGGIFVLSNIILGVILVLIINNTVSKTVEKELVERGRTVASNLANYTSEQILSEDVIGLKQIITNALSFESVEYILIQDSENNVMAKTFNGPVPNEIVSILPETDENKLNNITYLKENEPVTCCDIVMPVEDGYLGYIRVGMKQQYIENAVNEINILIISIIAAITLIGIIIVLILANRIISPIIYLTAKANEISQGNLGDRIEVKTNDEIKHLGEALERLRESVTIALERLKKRQTTRM